MNRTLKVPIEGTSVRRETTYPVATPNGYEVVGKDAPAIPTAPEAPEAQEAPQGATPVERLINSNSAAPIPAPTKSPRREPQTPLESFHPALIGKEVTIDEKGRIRVTARAEEPAAETSDEGGDGEAQGSELPALGQQHSTIPTGSEAAAAAAAAAQQNGAPSNEIQDLKNQLAQQNQILQAIVIGQANGKSVAEVLGIAPAQPAAEPDYSQYDLYDPDQRAAMLRQMKQDVKAEVMKEHQPTIEAARREQEFHALQAKHSSDPAWDSKARAAIKLIADNPSAKLGFEAAYAIVNHVASNLNPQSNGAATTAAPTDGGAKQATRTITAEQAAEKAAQAKKLPRDSGVTAKGAAPVPEHFGIGDLGKMMLWNFQQASRQ